MVLRHKESAFHLEDTAVKISKPRLEARMAPPERLSLSYVHPVYPL